MVNVVDDWFDGVIITAEREALGPSSVKNTGRRRTARSTFR